MNDLVKGKKKKGGILIQPDTKLCSVKFENNEEICIRSFIRGKIIEINEFIVNKDLQVVNEEPESAGFFFILSLPYNDCSIDKDYKEFVKVEADQEYN